MNETNSIHFTRIKAGSLFKLTLILACSVMIPFFTLCGIAAFFGAQTVTVNQEYVTGLGGFIAALLMGPVFSLIISVFMWTLSYVAIRVIGRFKPFRLDYVAPVITPTQMKEN